MPDYITRERLKKKVLERWENEGGMIPTEQIGAQESNPAKDHESERPQPPSSARRLDVEHFHLPHEEA